MYRHTHTRMHIQITPRRPGREMNRHLTEPSQAGPINQVGNNCF